MVTYFVTLVIHCSSYFWTDFLSLLSRYLKFLTIFIPCTACSALYPNFVRMYAKSTGCSGRLTFYDADQLGTTSLSLSVRLSVLFSCVHPIGRSFWNTLIEFSTLTYFEHIDLNKKGADLRDISFRITHWIVGDKIG